MQAQEALILAEHPNWDVREMINVLPTDPPLASVQDYNNGTSGNNVKVNHGTE